MVSKQPKRRKDWIGLTVINNVRMETSGGVIFPPGTEFRVTGVWRGLTIETIRQCPNTCPECGIWHRHIIREVRPENLMIVSPKAKARLNALVYVAMERANLQAKAKAHSWLTGDWVATYFIPELRKLGITLAYMQDPEDN